LDDARRGRIQTCNVKTDEEKGGRSARAEILLRVVGSRDDIYQRSIKKRRKKEVIWKKALIASLLVLTIFLPSMIPTSATETHTGTPRLDEIWYKLLHSSDRRVDALLAGEVDMISEYLWSGDIKRIIDAGYNITRNFDTDLGFFTINSRDYYPPEAGSLAGQPAQPLNDTAFRRAMAYVFGMDRKNQTILGFFGNFSQVFSTQSIVPPGQREWYNPKVKLPNTDLDIAWQILQNASYYVSDGILYNPDGTSVRDLEITFSGCLFSEIICGVFAEYMNEFFAYINATVSPHFNARPSEYTSFINSIFVYQNYDMAFFGLTSMGRFTDWLYHMFHSSNIGVSKWNIAGINDSRFDELLDIIKYSVNKTEVKEAGYEFQEYFNEVLPWIEICSTYSTVAYNPELINFVPMDCYSSDNDWTWMLMHWKNQSTGGTVKHAISEEPCSINPFVHLYGLPRTRAILDRVISKLIVSDPYTLENRPWIAYDWDVETGSWPELSIEDGERITFYLRNDVYWQDNGATNPETGEVFTYPVTSEDLKYSIETWVKSYAKYQSKPRGWDQWWDHLVCTEMDGPYIFRCYLNQTSVRYLNDIAEKALLGPKHIWERIDEMIENGTIENPFYFQPYKKTYKEITGNDPPAKYPFMKALIGSGPYVFDYYYEWPTEEGSVKRYDEFFANSSVEIVVGGYRARVDPGQAANYTLHLMNIGNVDDVTGELTSATVDVEIYVDDNLVNSITNITIPSFEYVTLGPFTTDALSGGKHPITAKVYKSGELIDTYTHEVKTTIAEDINLDCKVDMKDIGTAAKAFGSYPSHPRWDPIADINYDYKVDMKDIGAIASKFGWSY